VVVEVKVVEGKEGGGVEGRDVMFLWKTARKGKG